MSDDFIVYHQASDQPYSEGFVVHGAGDSDDEHSQQLLESVELEHFISDVYYGEFLGKRKGAKFVSSIISWMNHHMPFDKKVSSIEGDLRDGVKLCGLINALKMKTDLPVPAPSNDEEKKENLYHILSFLASEQHMEADHEVFEYAAQDIVTGDTQAILSVILNIIRHHVIDCLEDPVHGRQGIELLEYWAQEVVGMSGNLFCSDFVTTHIESDGNLERLAIHLKVELPQYLDFLSSQEKAAYLVEWFEKETGIPPLLDVTMKLEDGDAHLNMWYHLLRYIWLAEMYQFSLKTRKAKTVGENEKPTAPQDIILTAIYTAEKRERNRTMLVDLCRDVCDWSQEKIRVLKKEVAALAGASDIGSRSVIQLADIYTMMREEQQSYSEKKINCYKLHCDVQRKAQTIGNKELKYDPTYNIYKVEDLWNKMVKMEHQLEKRIQGYLLRAENKNSFFNQWKNEVSHVKQWMLRWQNHITTTQATLKDLGSCELRKCVKVFNKFGSDIDELDETKQARLLCNMLVEFSIDGEEQDTVISKTNSLCADYRQFLKDARHFIKELIAHQDYEAEIEVMYSEMADLLSKLDGQIHELNQYYSQRPDLHSVGACVQMSSYVRDTWNTLFDISYEVDAVISLWDDIERKKLRFGNNFPKNHFTSFNPKYILQRWSRLMEEARCIEEYIRCQREICEENQPAVEAVAERLDEASEILKSKISEIVVCLAGSNGNIMETGRDKSPVNNILMLQNELTQSFSDMSSMSEITDDLPNSGLFDDAFNKIVLLNECYSFCLATIDLVISGHDTYPKLIQAEGMASDVEFYQKELNCCKEKNQLLPKYENVVKLFSELDQDTKSQLIQQLKQEVEAVDPTFYRVPLSAWLNVRRDDLAVTELQSCSQNLKDCFASVSGHDEAILMGDVDKYIHPDLVAFLLKNMTEYFSNEEDLDDDAYDYKRLIAHLTGKKRKLAVPVEHNG
ncbi:uncharacterized protein LOC134826023 [Bolinopsis microptera]|uniref:uncharacterized protein LOC134826023 n=1 Tax=Bolinopsis microptera TaxID=2820187 RepID=UPI003078EE25